MADLSVNLLGVTLKNPLIAASGTFGYGREYQELYDIGVWGGVSVKGTTLQPRDGNPMPRIAETPAGMLNAIGLQNPGVEAFIREEIPFLRSKGTAIIANVAGATLEDYIGIAERLSGEDVDLLELNISCPNVKRGGATFGVTPEGAAEVTKAVKEASGHPVMVKLSPNVTDIAEIARAVEAAGADAISLINTLLGMRINIHTRRPILKNNVGGLSGPAVFPVAVRMVWQVARAVSVPVVGMGGIASAEDAIEMMLAGATAVQIGAALFSDPLLPFSVLEGMQRYCDEQGIDSIGEITGQVRPWNQE